MDVAVTPRVMRLIDSAAFQRLRKVSQLGLVELVYPGALHSRFEHSLGVYRNCVDVLNRLTRHHAFANEVDEAGCKSVLVAALLHDIGHWPFCHAVEDMQLSDVPPHESLARQAIEDSEIRGLLKDDWQLEPEQITQLLIDEGADQSNQHPLLKSILSGPIDIDKLDYLYRDSLHAGVPYGLNFDRQRLVDSLCLNESRKGLAIDEKGKTAAEMLVFARYIMFSEVYWHHAVRAATSMLQRMVYETSLEHSIKPLFSMTDFEWRQFFDRASENKPWRNLFDGLFGRSRQIFKRLAQFDSLDSPELHEKLARKDFVWLVKCGEKLADAIGNVNGKKVLPHQILIDAPPKGLEVQFHVDVHFRKQNRFRPLGDVSPLTKALATHQFDDMVKRVRVFVDPAIEIDRTLDVAGLLSKIVDDLPPG